MILNFVASGVCNAISTRPPFLLLKSPLLRTEKTFRPLVRQIIVPLLIVSRNSPRPHKAPSPVRVPSRYDSSSPDLVSRGPIDTSVHIPFFVLSDNAVYFKAISRRPGSFLILNLSRRRFFPPHRSFFSQFRIQANPIFF